MSKTEEFNKIMRRVDEEHYSKRKLKSVKVEPIKPRENMNPLQTSLSKCTIQGNKVLLPEEHLENYKDVRKALMDAGADYKRNTFVFPNEAQPYIDKLMDGLSINRKKETQFFATPPDIAEWMARELMNSSSDSILEPSAGQGALLDAVYTEAYKGGEVFYIEMDSINLSVLKKKYEGYSNFYHLHPEDNNFLKLDIENKFDRIIANPPFAKNQDIDHIYKMWAVLKPGGRIVTVASKHWQLSENKKEKAFKNWIENEVEGTVYEIEAGRFKSSGTMVSTCIIVIDKSKK